MSMNCLAPSTTNPVMNKLDSLECNIGCLIDELRNLKTRLDFVLCPEMDAKKEGNVQPNCISSQLTSRLDSAAGSVRYASDIVRDMIVRLEV